MIRLQRNRHERAAPGLLFLFWLGGLLLLTACARESKPLQLSGFTMGTSYHVTVVDAGEKAPETLQRELDQLLAVFNSIASTYIEDSELNRVNRAVTGEWLEISETLSDMLLLGTEVSWLTGGAFDMTVAPLVNLWGFGAEEQEPEVPSPEAIAAVMDNVGFQHLSLDFTEPRLMKQRDITLDLSAIAKGYGVDLVALWLERKGFQHFLVEIGGEVVTRGNSPRGDQWRLAIEKPESLSRSIQQTISVSGAGVATSGDYRNFFEQAGTRYSHTIDPGTGKPVTHGLASATVIHETAAYADALATAFSVMGLEKGLRFAEKHDIAVYLIEKTEQGIKTSYSPAFEKYLDSAQAEQ